MSTKTDPEIPLEFAISKFRTKSKLALALGLHRVTVTDWANKQKRTHIPPLHAYRLQRWYPELFGDKDN